MNERKLKQLFSAARQAPSPVPPVEFDRDVLRAVRAETRRAASGPDWMEDLNRWFPRLAWSCALFVALCVAGEFGSEANGLPTLGDGLDQISQQWLFALNAD